MFEGTDDAGSDVHLEGGEAAPAGAGGAGGGGRPAAAHEQDLELFYDTSYRVANGLSPAALLLASGMLVALSLFTQRADVAVGYRWGAAVIAAIAIPWALVWWRRLSRPALRASREGLVLDNGRVLGWDLFSQAALVKIGDQEWMGFRFRPGVAGTLDAASRKLLRGQDGWIAARLACAFPTRSVTVTRSQAIDRLAALSRLPLAGA